MKQVVVAPNFLSAGRQVTEDVTVEVAQGQRQNSELKIRITNHLAAAEGIGGRLCLLAGADGCRDILPKSAALYQVMIRDICRVNMKRRN